MKLHKALLVITSAIFLFGCSSGDKPNTQEPAEDNTADILDAIEADSFEPTAPCDLLTEDQVEEILELKLEPRSEKEEMGDEMQSCVYQMVDDYMHVKILTDHDMTAEELKQQLQEEFKVAKEGKPASKRLEAIEPHANFEEVTGETFMAGWYPKQAGTVEGHRLDFIHNGQRFRILIEVDKYSPEENKERAIAIARAIVSEMG